jgi:hypothetical protein
MGYFWAGAAEANDHMARVNRERLAAAEAKKAAERKAWTDGQDELARLGPLVEAGDVPALRRVVRVLADLHHTRHVFRAGMPSSAASANPWTHTVTTGAIENEEDGAVAIHEVFHEVIGPCPQRGAHYRDPSITTQWQCLACEQEAWAAALKAVPFSARMLARMRRSLASYQGTAATAVALEATERLTSPLAEKEHKQYHFKQRERREWLERMRREVAADRAKTPWRYR